MDHAVFTPHLWMESLFSPVLEKLLCPSGHGSLSKTLQPGTQKWNCWILQSFHISSLEEPPGCFWRWLHHHTFPTAMPKTCNYCPVLINTAHCYFLFFLVTAILVDMKRQLVGSRLQMTSVLSPLERLPQEGRNSFPCGSQPHPQNPVLSR